MKKENITLSIPVKSLIDSISALDIKDKIYIWKLLGEELENFEEDIFEKNPTLKSEIHEARISYKAGDYQTLDEYIAKSKHK